MFRNKFKTGIQIFPSFSRFKIWLKENFHYGFNATNGQIGWNNRYSDRVLEYINNRDMNHDI